MMASLFYLSSFLYVVSFSLVLSLLFSLLLLLLLSLLFPSPLFPSATPFRYFHSSFSRLPFPPFKIVTRNIEPSSLRMWIVVFESPGNLRVMSHHADFSTDFHVRSCYSVVPLTRSLTFLRFSRRHQQLFHPIVALSYSSCLTVRARERERERKWVGEYRRWALPQVFRRRSQPHVQTCHFYVHHRAYAINLILWNLRRYLFV